MTVESFFRVSVATSISGQSFSQPRSTITYAMPGSDHSKVAVTAVDDRGSFVELGTTIYSDGDMAMTRWSARVMWRRRSSVY